MGFAAHLRIGAFHSRFESVSWHSPPVRKLGVREFGYPMRTGRYRNHSRMCLQLINHATSFLPAHISTSWAVNSARRQTLLPQRTERLCIQQVTDVSVVTFNSRCPCRCGHTAWKQTCRFETYLFD